MPGPNMDLDGQSIIMRANKLFRSPERTNADAKWSELAEFILPSQSGVFETENTTPGVSRTQRLFDSTAIQANHDLAAAIHSTLTNPATKWSKLRFKREDLNNDSDATTWLESANTLIHGVLNESNFDTQISKNYQLMSAVGTMILLHEEKREDNEFVGFQFTAWHLSEAAFSENKDGLVDTVYRRFKLTARQAWEKWGKKVSEKIMEALDENPEQEFPFYHCIFPREPNKVDTTSLRVPPKKRAFASIYVDKTTGEIIEESGYYEFPVYVVRWQTGPGEVYGRGPGHIALPDIRTLNKVKDLGLNAIAKAVNPPMVATMRNVIGNLDLRPGKISVLRDPQGIRELVTQARFDVTQFSVEDLRNAIRGMFFIDKLMLPPRTETGEMTAFEVAERLQQMQRVLGPTLSRLNSEFLTPMVVRAFRILLRNNVLPPIPDIVKEAGLSVDISFVNQLSRSQQMDDLNNIRSWIQGIAGLAQVKPEVLDYVDADAIAKLTAKIQGVPEVAVTNDRDVEELRAQRAQQMQAQQALEAGTQMADIAAKADIGDILNGGGSES